MISTTEYYKQRPDKYAARKIQISQRRGELKDRVREYKKLQSCSVCGFSDYRAIDFHHRDPVTKTVDPSRMYRRGWGWERIMEELNKCDAMCKNCHAIHHHPDTMPP